MRPLLLALLLTTTAALTNAQQTTAQDRPVPPPGVTVSDNDRKDLEAGIARLSAAIDKLQGHQLAPDVIIYRDAARYALTYNEFFKPEEIARGKELLRQGQDRAEALLKGQAPWTTATGLVVRGYKSNIDDSIQPYGLVIPDTWTPKAPRNWRLDAWFHGRAETLSEVNFLWDRQSQPGQFTPRDTIVLHLYGRYCNANKFAGEVDLFEALEAVRQHYAIDDNRIVVRGFSMGGAAAWHIAAHHAGLWAAAAPGAGFSETADFLKIFANEAVKPHWWEQKLWRMYDATEYALNFFNLPLVAYSGEIDRQKQAADIMAKYLAEQGLHMTHIIGPQTPHRYHPDSKVEINRRIDAIADRGRDPYPHAIKFTTFTLAYNRVKWVIVDALAKHWERGTVKAQLAPNDRRINVATEGVTALTLDFGPGGYPLTPDAKPSIAIDGQTLTGPSPETDRSFRVHLRKTGSQWQIVNSPRIDGLHKRHNLQGPIDDAFMSRFLIVLPTGQPMHKGAAPDRIAAEQQRAIKEWRRQFRGEALVKKDTDVTDADIASSNLILWGDPSSNKVLAKVAAKLPAKWNASEIVLGGKSYSSTDHYPALIYPNPLNNDRYVVVNSGFTFREYDYLNNARQVSKLPDWAVIDAKVAADGRWPGRIAEAGFFNEAWQ